MRPANKEEIGSMPYFDPRLSLFFTGVDDEFMKSAITARMESTDKKHSTGAVVVKDGKVLVMESNKSGFKHQSLIRFHELGWCVRRLFRIPSGQKYWLCPGCAKSHDHAESRAARLASDKYGDRVQGGTLYLAGHWWCCKPCIDAMIRAGITTVVLEEGAKAKYGK